MKSIVVKNFGNPIQKHFLARHSSSETFNGQSSKVLTQMHASLMIDSDGLDLVDVDDKAKSNSVKIYYDNSTNLINKGINRFPYTCNIDDSHRYSYHVSGKPGHKLKRRAG